MADLSEFYNALNPEHQAAFNQARSAAVASTKNSGGSGSGGGLSDAQVYNTVINQKTDIAPVSSKKKKKQTQSEKLKERKKDEEEDVAPLRKLDFFKRNSLFDDGYDLGDISKTILGTVGDAGLGVLKGAGSLVEGVTDLANYGIAEIAESRGNDALAAKRREIAQRNMVDALTGDAEAYLDNYSVLGRTSDALTQGVGQVGGIILGGALAGAAGLGVAGTTALTTGVMGLSGMGSGMSEAYEGGADDKEAAIYGAISGASDALTELMFGGLGKAVKAVGLSKGLSSADDMLAKKISGMFTNQIAKNISEFGVKASAEGVEEIAAGVAQAIGKKMTYMSEKELADIIEDENLLEQFIVGAATSGMIQSGYVPGMSVGSLKEANKAGRDFITGLDQNEQAVINKEIENRIAEMEADGKELSKKDKDKLYDAVLKDMEKGYISIDTIEEVLGGDNFTAYNELKAESEEFSTLYKTESGKLSEEQRDRLAELKEKNKANPYESELKTAKDNLSKGVFSLVENGKLAESYNERGRRSEAFTADMSRYSEAQQKVIQKAVDSGILNNTNRTHEFVDLVAKISADKGVLFDFTDNAKLKESGFAVDGKQVNGFVTKDGITLNTDSAKYLNTVVGHEITHVLEGTEVYSELQNILFEYSKNKGDFDNRRSNLAELYKDVKDADIDAELTADLVGDYLFTDSDFINSLSTNNRNVFQKIYDEIKYLCKVVTAGSKEARELEKVKKAFDEAYRASGKAVETNSDARYSFSGVGAHTTDFSSLSEAAEMERNGKATPEEIRQQTGWFRGYDGRWRFEINDADMEFSRNGFFTNPDVIRYKELEGKVYFSGNATEAEVQELRSLRSSLDGVRKSPQTLGDYIKHEKLFEAYPQLKNIRLSFDYLEGDTLGEFNPKQNSITLDTKLLNDVEKLKDTLVHEIQHAIQRGEDFARGSSPGYWQRRINEGLGEEMRAEKVAAAEKKYADLFAAAPDALKEKMREIDNAKAIDDWDKVDELTDEIYNSEYEDLFVELEDAYFDIYNISERDFDLDAHSLYEQTAGEVEARDVSSRRKLTEEQRKNTRPDIDKTNVVFADAGTRYSLSTDSKGKQLSKEQQDYFKDSKVRDENGNLLVMYHGTKNGGFNVFQNKRRPATEGFYFTNSREYANVFEGINNKTGKYHDSVQEGIDEGYYSPETYEVYLDVKNPFVLTADQQDIIEDIGYWENIYKPIKNAGYDGVMIEDKSQVFVFNSNQIKRVDNTKPTEDADIRYSLGEQQQTYGDYNVSGKDIALAPVKETVAENTTVPEQHAYFAPTSEEEAMADADERFASLSDEDIPPEMEAPYPGESSEELVSDPFEERDYKDVGNRKVKAFMWENPEVKPKFQFMAEVMLNDLRNSIKGERFYNDQLAYDTNYEYGWTGQSRQTTDDIAYLLDSGYTYAQIEKGLQAIIEDNGAENNAISKRIEFALNDRLYNGFTDINGYEIPADQEYIDALGDVQMRQTAEESFGAITDADAPPVVEDIAPVKATEQAAPTLDEVKVKGKGNIRGQKVISEVAATKETPKDSKTANIVENANRLPRDKRNAGLMAATKLVDKGQVFENLSLKTGNMELQAKYDYALPSKSEARAQFFMERGSKKDGVKSLDSIRKAVGKNEAEFDQYLYNLHNIDRMTLDERFGIENKAVYGDSVTAEDSRKMVAALEKAHPEFKQIANDVYKYNNHLRKLLVDNGVISQKTANLWQKMYPHYVPIHRVDDAGVSINVPLDSKKTGVNAPVKRATGGNSDFQTAFNTMAERTIQTYKAIAKNSFGVELKNTLGSTITQNTAALDEVIDSIDTHEELLKPGKQGMNPTFTVFENGERVEFEITEDMFDALKPADPFLSQTIKPLKAVSEIRRNMLTSWNPVFALYRNPVKDIQDVVINSQHPAKTYMNVPKAVIELASNGKYATEYFANGGKQNTYYDSDKNTFDQRDSVLKKITGLGALERAGEFIEAVPRLAEYIASREDGRTIERSMLDAARVTTNFAAGGDVTKFANRHGVTFLNASVQGAAQHVRNIREAKMNGLKGWVKLAAKYTAAGLPAMLLNGLLWEDDEDYEELSEYVKDSYYVIAKTEDGKFIRIPKGRTAAVIQDGLEQIGRTLSGDEEADWNNFFELFMNNIAPNNPIENNILAPIGQVLNNKTWYGEDLVPSRLADLPKEEQFDESTDAISKWLGEKTGTSPVKWNYILDQYSGGLGDMVLPMLTPEVESGAETLKDYAIAPWKKELTTDKVLNNKYPGEFYEMRDVLEINANAKDATEEDNLKYMYMDDIGWEMSALYAEKREIQNSDMSNSDKYEAIKEVQAEINALAEKALRGYNNVYHEGLYAEVGDKRFDYNAESGKWYEITPQNYDGSDNWYYQKEQEVTQGLGISYSDYWNNREEYNFAYDKPGRYAIAQAVGGYRSYMEHYDVLENWQSDNYLAADKDANGNSISGSRKTKVMDYINGLDLDYGEKLILYRTQYSSKADKKAYNMEIIDYLNSRDDISYQEMKAILEELDMKVDSEGNITW